MTVRANKPAFNIREKLKELTHSVGLKGRELMRAATVQDARDLVSAGRKNLVQNGDFRVNQRGGTHTTINGGIFDRWKFQNDLLSEYAHSVTQSSDAPDGFNNSLRLEVTTSESTLGASDDLCLTQHVEGQDCQALMAGTGSAKPFTLSFWVKSNKTGTYSVTANVAGSTVKQFATTYTINQVSVWEYKVVRIPPCPQTIADNTSGNLTFRWILNAGSNYTSAASGNMNQWDDYHSSIFAGGHETQIMTDGDVWQLTGVQVEAGANATDFEYRSYGEELALCQRYYQRLSLANYTGFPLILRKSGGGAGEGAYRLSPPMRTTPSGGFFGSGIINGWTVYTPANNTSSTVTSITLAQQNQSDYITDTGSADYVQFQLGGMSGSTGDVGILFFTGGSQNNQYYFSSEL